MSHACGMGDEVPTFIVRLMLLHKIRPHKGQVATAKTIRELLEGSEIMLQPKAHVQDPYSFSCH